MDKYYIVETIYVGPNPYGAQNIDADRIEIRTEPARANMSGEVRIDGWCGTTDNWSVYAHGEYDTLADARKAVIDIFGECRECELDEYHPRGCVVEAYKEGKLTPMGENESGAWIYEAMRSEITADSTADDTQAFSDKMQHYAEYEGYKLLDVTDMVTEYRDRLISERADGEDDEA